MQDKIISNLNLTKAGDYRPTHIYKEEFGDESSAVNLFNGVNIIINYVQIFSP